MFMFCLASFANTSSNNTHEKFSPCPSALGQLQKVHIQDIEELLKIAPRHPEPMALRRECQHALTERLRCKP